MIIAGEKKKKQDLATYEAINENFLIWNKDFVPPQTFSEAITGGLQNYQMLAENQVEQLGIDRELQALGLDVTGDLTSKKKQIDEEKAKQLAFKTPKDYDKYYLVSTGKEIELHHTGGGIFIDTLGKKYNRGEITKIAPEKPEKPLSGTTLSMSRQLDNAGVLYETDSIKYKYDLLKKFRKIDDELDKYKKIEGREAVPKTTKPAKVPVIGLKLPWKVTEEKGTPAIEESVEKYDPTDDMFLPADEFEQIKYNRLTKEREELKTELWGDETEEGVRSPDKSLDPYWTKLTDREKDEVVSLLKAGATSEEIIKALNSNG